MIINKIDLYFQFSNATSLKTGAKKTDASFAREHKAKAPIAWE